MRVRGRARGAGDERGVASAAPARGGARARSAAAGGAPGRQGPPAGRRALASQVRARARRRAHAPARELTLPVSMPPPSTLSSSAEPVVSRTMHLRCTAISLAAAKPISTCFLTAS